MIKTPTSVTVASQTNATGAGVGYGTATTIKVQITPQSSGRVLADWGIDLQRPYLMLTQAANASYLTIAGMVTWGTRRFRIVAPPMTYSFGKAADHTAVVLEELQFDA